MKNNYFYDENKIYHECCDVKNGSWVLITRQVPVINHAKPHLFGIYWGVPKNDKYGRQVCVIHTTEDVTLLNHEYVVIDEERLKVYQEEGWELHEINANTTEPINTKLIEQSRDLSEDEREIIMALQLDGLTENQACEEYFFTHHADYNNFNICYLPNPDVYAYCVGVFGER